MAQLKSLARDIDGVTYRSNELPALTKVRAAARLAPLLKPFLGQFGPLLKLAMGGGFGKDATTVEKLRALDVNAMFGTALEGALTALSPNEAAALVQTLLQSTFVGNQVLDSEEAINAALVGQGLPHILRLLLFAMEANDFFGFPAIGKLTKRPQEAGESPVSSTPA